jgi:hypothetical protein
MTLFLPLIIAPSGFMPDEMDMRESGIGGALKNRPIGRDEIYLVSTAQREVLTLGDFLKMVSPVGAD